MVSRGLQLRRHLWRGVLVRPVSKPSFQKTRCRAHVNRIAHTNGQLSDGVDGQGAVGGADSSEGVQGVASTRLIG